MVGGIYWHVKAGDMRIMGFFAKSDCVDYSRRLAKELSLPLYVEGKLVGDVQSGRERLGE